ncbi:MULTISPECIES: hypothetical protein [Burkholderia]|uniref:hypothetical protein n=1 Tax=Burkholderia TaxID=32008 RepID=UPI001E53F4EE|nr:MULTISPECIES: hypothetical protein [Burkholderia]
MRDASSMGRLAARIVRAAGKRSRFRLRAAGGSAAAPGADGEALVGQTSSSGVRLSDSSRRVLHFFTFDEAIFHAICNVNAYTFATPFEKRRITRALLATSRRIFVNHLKECCDGSSFVHQGSG